MTESLPGLSAAERERLLDRLQDRLATGAAASEIRPRPAGGPVPASLAQRRLWFLDRLDPANAAYHVPVTARLLGPLDIGALDRAIRYVCDRHEALRTTFGEVDGEPVQRVAPTSRVRLVVADPAEENDLAGWLAAQCYRPFDLAAGPLIRWALWRQRAEEHVLVMTAHHIVVDGWSLGALFGDLAECYRAFHAGHQPRLAPLPVQYPDFAVWQRDHLDERVSGDLEYWLEVLAGAPAVLDLPRDPGPPGLPAFAGGVASRSLAPDLTARVRALAADTGTTVFMVVLAALGVVLGRLAGVDDLVVGVPIAGRARAELDGLVGYFLNTVALRLDLSGEPSFATVLERVRAGTTNAQAHQDLPFERLVEALRPERTVTHTPVFQVLVNHTSTVPLVDRLGPVRLEFFEVTDPPSKFPLTVYIRDDGPDALGLDALFQTAAFAPERIGILLGQLEHLLDQVTADRHRPVSGCSLVTAETRSRLPDLSARLVGQPVRPVRAMVEDWVRATPRAAAVCWSGGSISYAELWRRAETIRHVLAVTEPAPVAGGRAPDRPVPPDPVVAVTGPRSPGLIAAMVAVLAGGGVLLTVDPRLPRLRQQVMLAEAGTGQIVVVGDDPEVDLDGLGVVRVDPDSGWPVGDRPDGPVPAARERGEAGYVFFTSGTTGVPKAVLGRRAGLAHFLAWQRDTFGVGPADRCAHLTGLSFDVVLRDVFLPLVSGAALCLPDESDEAPDHCLGWLAEQSVTCVHAVPAVAEAWLAGRVGDAAPRSLRLTFFAGEPLTGRLVRAWRDACGDGLVINLYGPTETTLAKCAYQVPADCPDGVQPVGTAIPGAQALVLGRDGLPCGIGEVGEITIRTPYGSLGYLNADAGGAWTPNPGGEVGDLLYHSGDLGRYRLDGGIDILGRRDRQVKIRGIRVDTGEVAATAARHPAVRHAVVAARPGPDGQPSLVAYLVASEGTTATDTQVRRYLARRLPAAMVPATLVFVDRIPRTANGKTDWDALPPPDPVAVPGTEFVPPRTDTERRVTEIMAALLGCDRVSVHDSFFALGGHSLLAMQLVSRLAEACGVTLALRAVFDEPTAAGIAAAIDGQ